MTKGKRLHRLMPEAPKHKGDIKLPEPIVDSLQKHVLAGGPIETIKTDFPPWLKERLALLADSDPKALDIIIRKSDFGEVVELPPEGLRDLNPGVLSTIVGTSLSLKSLKSIRRFCDVVVEMITNQELMPLYPAHVGNIVNPEQLPPDSLDDLESSTVERLGGYLEGLGKQVDVERFVFIAAQVAVIMQS